MPRKSGRCKPKAGSSTFFADWRNWDKEKPANTAQLTDKDRQSLGGEEEVGTQEDEEEGNQTRQFSKEELEDMNTIMDEELQGQRDTAVVNQGILSSSSSSVVGRELIRQDGRESPRYSPPVDKWNLVFRYPNNPLLQFAYYEVYDQYVPEICT
jgi:hypothetical protein